MLLQLCLFVVTVIELTSSQPTYDVIQQENDANSCERTEQSCSQVQLVNSQLVVAVSQLQRDMQLVSTQLNQLNNVELMISQLLATVSQLQRDVAELKTVKPQNKTKGTCGVQLYSQQPRVKTGGRLLTVPIF